MLQTYKSYTRRTLAMLLAVLVAVGALFSGSFPVHAADGTISYKAGANIPYGSYFTSRMSFDGSNTAYCVEPLKKTPSSGSYSYDLLSQNSPLRKALYYLNGGYGYDKVVKDKYFSGWSDDNSYVIGHLVVAYIYAGNSADTGAFHGAPQSYIDKALEVASAIQGLPNPPEGFRAFIVPGQGSQTIAGSWYQVPNGWIELKKSSANGSVSDGNPNYSLKGAVYGIYQGEKLIQKLTTDENGYARSGELEEGDYTIKELSASKGYIVDTKAHKVTVKAEQTSAANVTDIPQNNPMNLVLEKLDAETKKASPQGAASLANAEFTVNSNIKRCILCIWNAFSWRTGLCLLPLSILQFLCRGTSGNQDTKRNARQPGASSKADSGTSNFRSDLATGHPFQTGSISLGGR